MIDIEYLEKVAAGFTPFATFDDLYADKKINKQISKQLTSAKLNDKTLAYLDDNSPLYSQYKSETEKKKRYLNKLDTQISKINLFVGNLQENIDKKRKLVKQRNDVDKLIQGYNSTIGPLKEQYTALTNKIHSGIEKKLLNDQKFKDEYLNAFNNNDTKGTDYIVQKYFNRHQRKT